ncbi:cyclin-dependent kinase inhibitor 1Ba isoform X2 [Denticeps clupeoides]|uniref:cyclin-dependent kinase inhibitor 1Ba isoform X2 n=1 Tax=Denticeps clupeoides TaxID=299321 RepID=UPI0010A40CAE|nr:cyclin-dependent kinase inhibitor 1B-like isoform X2 [Denticeps clupeoides]
MSNVRLSNGSPTLERVDARQAEPGRPPVCRNLFGTGAADPERFQRDCAEQMRELGRAAAQTWNFDFAKDAPLSPGKYEWSQVDGRDLPEFYTRRPHTRLTARRKGDEDEEEEEEEEEGRGARRKRCASPGDDRRCKRGCPGPAEQTPGKPGPGGE